ncbi:MAG: hypothetical protein H6709_17780 [Kofleriaceae bacterium]|nr:hypothetical protein [Kofleriaceae bacterium]MCB9573935.1 hypothetical protein [Kofleriaceae bacterium]
MRRIRAWGAAARRGAPALALALVLGVAGCLSTPPPANGDGGVAPDAAVDPCVRDPRPATACDLPGDFTATPLAGAAIRQVWIDDLNGDGVDDLLLAGTRGADDGLYVALGPIDPAAPAYQQFLVTGAEVHAVAVRDVVGPSPCADLAVLAVERTDDVVIAQLWAYQGGASPYVDVPAVRVLDFQLFGADAYMHAAWVRRDATGDDLWLSDSNHLRILRTAGAVDAFATAPIDLVYRFDTTPGWDSINGVEAVPTADCGRDEVLVIEGGGARYIGQNGGGDPAGVAPFDGQGVVALGTVRADVDGVAPDDVLIGGARSFGVYLRAYQGADLVTTLVTGDTGYDAYPDSYRVDGQTVLAGPSSLDWAFLDGPDGTGTGTPQLGLVHGVHVAGGALAADAARTIDVPAALDPLDVVAGDLDGDGTRELWIVGRGGQLRCARVTQPVPGLQLCP